MKNGFDEKVKGHGFFRKTKAFGLASGIALGAALLVGANTVSADEVAPAQPATTASATNQSGDAKVETVVVDDGLTAKVKQMETEGFIIKQDATKSVGTANNAEEAKTLEAKAKAEEQAQIKEFDKMLQEKRAAVPDEQKKVAEVVEKTLKSSDRYSVVMGELNRVQRNDFNDGKSSFSANDVKSDKGKPQFVKLKSNANDTAGAFELYKDKNNYTVSETPSTNMLEMSLKQRERSGIFGFESEFKGEKSDKIPFISLKVREGETITYTYNLSKDSEMAKTYGVTQVEKKFTLKQAPTSDKSAFLVIYPQMGVVYSYFVIEDGKKVLPNDMITASEVILKDDKGNVVDSSTVAAEAFNQVFFGGHKAVTPELIKTELIDKQAPDALKVPDKYVVDKESLNNSYVNSGVEHLKNGKLYAVVSKEYFTQYEEGKKLDTKASESPAYFYERQPSKFTWFADKYKDLKYSLRSYNVQKAITTTYVPNDKLNPNETKVTDDGKQSGKKVVEVGTKPSEKVEETPFKEETRPNPALPEGERKVVQEGVKGRKVTRTTYTLDTKTGKITPKEEVTENTAAKNRIVEVGTKKPDSVTEGELVTVYRPNDKLEAGKQNEVDPGKKSKLVNGKETEAGKPRIIEVGTKPVVMEKEIPFKETVVQNPSKPEGTRTVLKEGKVGKETTTTTYTLDTKTGKVTPDTKTTVVKAEDRLVEVGTGKNVTGDVETQYVPDTELEPGQSKVVQEGTPEVKDVTGKVLTPGKPTIIHIGTKPKVVEEEVPFKEETRENKDLPKGERKIVQEGKVGKKVTTTTYMVDPKTGKVTSEDKVEETAAVNKIIEVGTKEEVKATPAPQTPAAPKAQLPHTGTEASLALTLAGLAIAGIATTMVLKKKEQ